MGFLASYLKHSKSVKPKSSTNTNNTPSTPATSTTTTSATGIVIDKNVPTDTSSKRKTDKAKACVKAIKTTLDDFTPLTEDTVETHKKASAMAELYESSSDSYIHRLPGELRNRIYRDCIVYGGPGRLDLEVQPNLAHAYPDLASEINSIFFAENSFEWTVYLQTYPRRDSALFPSSKEAFTKYKVDDIPTTGPNWLGSIDAGKRTLIRKVELVVYRDNGSQAYRLALTSGSEKASKPRSCSTTHAGSRWLPGTPMANARAVMKGIRKTKNFKGFIWSDLQQVAACFEDIARGYRLIHTYRPSSDI